jgi:chromosome partitioning protein
MSRPSHVFAVANQKGGVGKTTSAVNLAASFAVSERPTLLIDLDPQANATSAFGVSSPEHHVYDALLGDRVMKEVTLATDLRFLQLGPSGRDLVGAEIELVPMPGRERRLELALADVREKYEIIVIDCPPSLGLLTLNALTAADSVIVPLQCEYYALEGLARLLETIDLVRASLNPALALEGIAGTMVDVRNSLGKQVLAEVRTPQRSAEPRQADPALRRALARCGGLPAPRRGAAAASGREASGVRCSAPQRGAGCGGSR